MDSASAIGALGPAIHRFLDALPLDDESPRCAGHLPPERDALLLFLADPELDATNYRAEQAIRPAVVNRKLTPATEREPERSHRKR